MKDVAKFLNQEVDLKPLGDIMNTTVDLNKCAQVAAVVAIFGVIPAFTYGTVLGNLDAQKEILVSQVSSLRAEVLSASQSIPKSNKAIYSVATDKEAYTTGSPVQLTFYSSLPASTTNIYQISLYSTSGALIQNIATMNPYQGPNRYSFTVATSTMEKGGELFVRVTATKHNQSADSNKFTVKAVYSKPKVTLTSSSEVVQFNLDDTASDDQGRYAATFTVDAKESPVFIKLGKAVRGTQLSNAGVNYVITSASGSYAATTTGSVSSELSLVSGGVIFSGGFVKVDAWSSAKFKLNVYFDPSVTDFYRLQLYSVNYNIKGNDADMQLVLLPTYIYQTEAIAIQDEVKSVQPSVTVRKMNAVAVSGFGEGPIVSDLGLYRFLVRVAAGDSDLYIPKKSGQYVSGDNSKGFVFSHSGGQSENSWAVSVVSDRPVLVPEDTATHFFIKKGSVRSFNTVVSLAPRGNPNTQHSLTFKGFNWGATTNSVSKFTDSNIAGPSVILGDR